MTTPPDPNLDKALDRALAELKPWSEHVLILVSTRGKDELELRGKVVNGSHYAAYGMAREHTLQWEQYCQTKAGLEQLRDLS